MYVSVGSVLDEAGVCAEVVVFAMLEDEESVSAEQLVLEDAVGQGRQRGQGVGRVGKDEVVLQRSCIDEAEDVAADEAEVVDAELPACGYDEVLLCMSELDACDLSCSSADALYTDAARSGKEVQNVAALDVDAVGEEVEEALLGKVGSRPRGDISRGHQSAPPICTGNDTHWN